MNKFFKIGFWIGFAMVFIGTLGLISQTVEMFSDIILMPARSLLMPFNDLFSTWPGLLNIIFMAAVNGLIYGIVFYVVSLALKKSST